MNKISAKRLLRSKFTKSTVANKEKHFIVTLVEFDEDQSIIKCIIEAVYTGQEYDINWLELKNSDKWKVGWY